MTEDLAAANVNRAYQLTASSIAIFTFQLIFLYPRFANHELDAGPFQATLVVMGLATFSFAFASFNYYAGSLRGRMEEEKRARYCRRADRIWLMGCILLFLTPSLVLFVINLPIVGAAWLGLWLCYLFFTLFHFVEVQTGKGP